MSPDVQQTLNRLSGLRDRVLRSAGDAVTQQAEALAAEAGADGTGFSVEPGDTPLERRVVAEDNAARRREFGARQRPAQPVLLRSLMLAAQSWPARLSASLDALFRNPGSTG